MIYYLQGLTIGLAYVAPIGLQNLFVINTALTQPKIRIFLTVLIIVFFDITLFLASFYGVGALMQASKWLELAILLMGSILVLWIGFGLIRSKVDIDHSTDVNIPLLKVITTACVVTWFNPQALIDGSLLFGAFKATLPEGQDLAFILGVSSASILWFSGVSTVISIFSAKFTPKALRIINVISGVVIMFYGAKLGYNFIQIVRGML